MVLHKSLSGQKDFKDTRKYLVLRVKLLILIVYRLLNHYFYSFLPLSSELLPEMVKVVFLTGISDFGLFETESLQLYVDGKMSTSAEAVFFPVL